MGARRKNVAEMSKIATNLRQKCFLRGKMGVRRKNVAEMSKIATNLRRRCF